MSIPLPADIATYKRLFRDPELGLPEARAIVERHGLQGAIRRNFDGSNLVFELNGCWLKMCPPFWRDAYQSELQILEAWGGRLPVATPRLIAADNVGDLNYLVTSHVAGDCYARVRTSLSAADRVHLADDVGRLIGTAYRLSPLGLLCEKRSWVNYAKTQILDAERTHLARGCAEVWAKRIAAFLEEMAPQVLDLSHISTVHADLNHAHLLFDGESKRLCGLIDFADAIDAPVEVEFIMPFLDCFRRDFALQRRAIEASGVPFGFGENDFSNGLMALTLLNRFVQFDDWFDVEIERLGTTSIAEIAAHVFPERPL